MAQPGWTEAPANPVGVRKALVASVGAYALDGFDFMIFTLALSGVIATFHLSTGQGGTLASATLFISAFGGLLAGTVADYLGRARTLALTVLLYALFTGLTALATSYQSLLVIRALEGLGFGGTWGAGAALLSEVAPSKLRGRYLGYMQSGWAVGWGAALILFLLVSQALPASQSWRILFLIGALPALFVVYILRAVREPEVWRETVEAKRQLRAQGVRSKELGLTFFQLFAPDLIGRTLLALLLSTGALFGYYSIFVFLPVFLHTVRHLSAVGSGPYLALVVVGSWVGYITSGWLNDRIGRRGNFLLFSVGSAIVILLYTHVVTQNALLIPLSFPLGFFASGIFSGFGSYLAELFPTRARGAAQGFTYNGGRAMAAFAPALVGYLSGSLGGLGGAISVFGPIAYLLCVIALIFLPETRGKHLQVMD